MNRVRTLLIVGTRPEAIKMAPVIRECQHRDDVEPVICFTGQHREMLAQVAKYFHLEPDVDLDVMRPNQTLASLTCRCLEGIDRVITQYQPDFVVAQGDTTTVLASSTCAFYQRVPFVHVEAGLRTGNLYSPWPEEFNRRVAGLTAAVHCAPTDRAAANLLAERVPAENVHVTGNTVIDALLWTVKNERMRDRIWRERYPTLEDHRMVLITGHRRENFGPKFESVCQAIARLANEFGDIEFIYPVHLNPNVREPVHRMLGNTTNVHLTEPVSYPEFVWLMDRAVLILTDSGGVQEEAPSLKKPVLVTRDTTERPEAVDTGAAQLVGTDQQKIFTAAARLLTDNAAYADRQIDSNPYGDGHAAEKIVQLIASHVHDKRAAA